MKVSNSASVPVYTISGSSTARPLPEWLARKRKRSLKNDPEYASRIELLQDFEFEGASNCIRVSEDGNWAVSTGTYKPQIHVHELDQLSLSFARHTVSENKTFEIISADYSKTVLLQEDRSVELHTPTGCHHTTRIPRYGRDLKLDRQSAEAIIPASGVNADGMGEVYRLNLELGRFMKSYELDVGGDNIDLPGAGALQGSTAVGSVEVAAIAEESHNLQAFGTSLGTVELWDPRYRRRAALLSAFTEHNVIEGRQRVTALDFHRSGLTFAAGSSSGVIQLYDLRSARPFRKRDQGFGNAIRKLIHLIPSSESQGRCAEPKLLSADERMIKIWDDDKEGPWTSIEPAVKLNDVAWCKDSGIFLTANEGRQQHAFFVPQLGPAPEWCAFLDNLVEEMAEDSNDPNAYTQQKAGEVYDNYKFLTMEQLEALSLAHLVGTTTLLRPYMHGFFVPQKLYEEAKIIADPYVWEEERAKRVKDRIEKERDSRIRGNKKAVTKVNRKLAEKIIADDDRRERREARRVLEQGGNAAPASESVDVEKAPGSLLKDSRFAKLFEDEAFAIDEESTEFKMLNPNKPKTDPKRARGLTAVEQEEADNTPGSSDGDDSDDQGSDKDDDDNDAGAAGQSKGRISTASYRKRPPSKTQKGPAMHVTSSARPAVDRSFGSRKAVARPQRARSGAVVGDREVSFVPSRKKSSKAPVFDASMNGHRDRKVDRRSASGNTFRRM